MIIDAYLTPYFPETEDQFKDSIVLMIDVLRASTTVAAAINNNAKEVIATEALDKAVALYNSLDRDVRFLGGERNGIKPPGFDAGNSPEEFSQEAVDGKTVIISTTNGTKIFQKAKQAKYRLIASFVNHSVIIEFINHQIEQFNQQQIEPDENAPINKLKPNITIFCAGNNGRLSYEDTLCAGAYIDQLARQFPDSILTDTADVARNLYIFHKTDLVDFIKRCQHSLLLSELGFHRDIETALTFDIFPVVPVISGNSIKKLV
jgi:2-phosphosulfolactate phosphatase